MTKPSRIWALGASLVLAGSLAACGGGGDDGATSEGGGTPTATDGTTDPAAAPTEAVTATADASDDSGNDSASDMDVTVMTAESDLGTILVDGDGMTLYLFTNDSPGVSTCEDACLTAWPPLLGSPEDGPGVESSLLGTLTRSDGTTQISYNGWPLYYWAADAAPGDTTGQAVNGVWWVVSPAGEAIGATQ